MEEKISKIKILKEAIKAVPIMKYALAVLGLASVVAIIHGFGIDFDTVIVRCVIILVVMFLLILIAFFAKQVKKTKEKWAKILVQVVVWAFGIMTIAVCALFISSYFFKWPLSLSQSKQPVEKPVYTKPIEEKRQEEQAKTKKDREKILEENVSGPEKIIPERVKKKPIERKIDKIGAKRIKSDNGKNKKKEDIKISASYRCPDCREVIGISSGSVVHSGGVYWFDIELPEMHGYLIVYQIDSKGKIFNLFPGTKEALNKGHYKVPYNLFYDCSTNHLEIAAKNSEGLIEKNIIRIGSYKFDKTVGDEQFFFYYSNERSPKLKNFLSGAIPVGKDISPFKGTVPEEEPESLKLRINHPLKIAKTITFRLIHKNQERK